MFDNCVVSKPHVNELQLINANTLAKYLSETEDEHCTGTLKLT